MNPRIVLLLAAAGCSGEDPTTPSTTPLPPDQTVEPCNGRDDDRDGFVDEGNDIDEDGLPDCFDTEECDGLDNDGNGLVDDGFDADGDGIGDCLDVEECDGLDNDGDTLIDEDFPDGCEPCDGIDNDGDDLVDEDTDVDGDGIGDCFDAEECDGIDNTGEGLIDEGLDADWDGICDADDVEICDGWDNDGDGLRDEGFDGDGDGLPDCWIADLCDGQDEDGDGVVDEEWQDSNGDGVPDCRDTCREATEWTICQFNGPSFTCSGANPITLSSQVSGLVFDVNMDGWTTLVLRGRVTNGAGYLWHVADSPTCDGFGGDAGNTVYDSEALGDLSGAVVAWDSQLGGAATLLLEPSSVAFLEDDVTIQVCEGWFGYRARIGVDGPLEAESSTLFQYDGTEVDFERPGGRNDTVLHVGVNRTVGNAARAGTGFELLEIRLGR